MRPVTGLRFTWQSNTHEDRHPRQRAPAEAELDRRVIYALKRRELTVVVIRVGHRSEVYE